MSTPAPPACLIRPYSANPEQRGGTLIAEQVVDREEHRRLLSDPDAYRPERCLHCDDDRLHAHDFRERHLRGEGGLETFRRYRCAGCGAAWFVLAGFMARHLHRAWAFVEAATTGDGDPATRPPARTLLRWFGRLSANARHVLQALATSGVELGGAAYSRSRAELLVAMVRGNLLSVRRRMAELAGWLHRLVPGLRLV